MALETEDHRCIPCEDGRKLLLGALLLRVAWALAARKFWGYHDDGAYDDGVYLEMARAFWGRDAVLATHPPGYPLFLAPFLALGGDLGVSLARWAQMFVSAATSVLAYRLALGLRLPRTEALISGTLVAVHPMLVYFSARMMSETLFAVLVVGFFLVWLSAWLSGRKRTAALAGVLGGVATLTRGVMLPFGGALALVAFWKRREQPRWVQLVAVCGLCWAGVLAPWTARNWAVYRRFVPVSIQGGWNFYEGLTVDPDDIRFKRAAAMSAESDSLGLHDVFARDAYFGAKAKAWVRDNPVEFLRLCAIKAARFWRPAPEPPHGLAVRVAVGFFSLVLFVGVALGLRRAGALPGAWFLLTWVLYLNVLHAVFASNLRYRLPIEPVLAVLAGAGLARVFRASAETKA